RVVPMSATPGKPGDSFKLTAADRRDENLRLRLEASKLAHLDDEVPTLRDDEEDNQEKLANRLADKAVELSKEVVCTRLGEFTPGIVGIVVNRVDTARRVFKLLIEPNDEPREVILLTGRIRPIDRDRLLHRFLSRMKADPDRDRTRREGKRLFVVAT